MHTKSALRTQLASLALIPLLTLTAQTRGTDPFQRFHLPDGIQLVVWHVEDAPRQSTFTFLPLGLASDRAQCAQYSHLVEHMIIRSTDPEALKIEGIQFNGETSSGALRIESYAQPDKWQASLERHLRWLQLDEVDAEVLKREKGRIQSEERSTVGLGYTHKWAEAGWNQVVRHGLPHASVHGDVVKAVAADVMTYAKRALSRHDQILIASVGPIDPIELRDFLAHELAELSKGEEPQAAVREASSIAKLEHVSKQATWDLAAQHYMEWMPLPDETPSDRIAGGIVVQLLNMGLYGDKSIQAGKALASVVVVPEGRYLMLSANLTGADQVEQASESFKRALQGISKGATIPLPMALMQAKYQATAKLDPKAFRKQLAALNRDLSLIEAQMLLTAIVNERLLGMNFDEIVSAWEPIDVKWMEAYLERLEKLGPPSSLLLQPK